MLVSRLVPLMACGERSHQPSLEPILGNPTRSLDAEVLGIPKLMIGKSPHQFHRALPNTRAFDDGNVAIDGEIREGLDAATRLWPANFQPIDFGSCADAQDFSGVV